MLPWSVGRCEITEGLAAIEQLAAEKSELSDSLSASREAYEKLCQEKNDLSDQLDASRNECTTVSSQLDVRRISNVLFCYPSGGILSWSVHVIGLFLHVHLFWCKYNVVHICSLNQEASDIEVKLRLIDKIRK